MNDKRRIYRSSFIVYSSIYFANTFLSQLKLAKIAKYQR